MAVPFIVGDVVECIEEPSYSYSYGKVQQGRLYTVERCEMKDGDMLVWIQDDDSGYFSRRFKLVRAFCSCDTQEFLFGNGCKCGAIERERAV